jgi:hypothetical protein
MKAKRVPAAKSGALAARSYQAAESAAARRVPFDGAGSYHADPRSRDLVRRICRSMDRNASVFSGPLTTCLFLLLGDGTWPRPRFTGPESDHLSQAWGLDAADSARCPFDADGRMSLADLLHQFGRAYLRDGDVLGAFNTTGQVRLVEGDRLCVTSRPGKTIIDGLELSDGKEVAYWVADYGPGGIIDRRTIKRVPRDSAVFSAYRDRVSAARGVSPLAAAVENLDLVDRMGDSEAATAAMSARVLSFIERTGNDENADIIDQNRVEIGDAAMVAVPKGWKSTPNNTNRPNLNVPAFRLQEMRSAYMVLGIPFELLTQDLNQLNFAASRSLKKLAETGLGQWRRRIFGALLSRLVSGWLAQRGQDPTLPVAWDWPRLDLHDRNKEAAADSAEIENRTASRRRLVGPDRLAILDELAEEERHQDALLLKRIEAADVGVEALRTKRPEIDLTWRDVVQLPGVSQSVNAAPPEAPNEPPHQDPKPTDPATVSPETPTETP